MTSHGLPEGSLGRVLRDITVGTIQAVRSKDHADQQLELREMEEQFQVPITGTAVATPSWAEVTLAFDNAFFFAPGQRDSNLEFPHFTHGSHTNPPVGVHCTIKEWLHDDSNGSIIGAVVSIGAVGANDGFAGFAHLTFQGFGALAEEDDVPIVNEG